MEFGGQMRIRVLFSIFLLNGGKTDGIRTRTTTDRQLHFCAVGPTLDGMDPCGL